MSVKEIEKAIRELSSQEVDLLASWIEEYRADAWDRQIEADALAGNLDRLADEADREFNAGRCTPL
jgi:hypothetical protein